MSLLTYPDDPARTSDRGYFASERTAKWPAELAEPTLAEIKADIAEALKFALIRKHCVSWRQGDSPQAAADAIWNAIGEEIDEAFKNLVSGIANGASDADVAALAREWQELATQATVDSLMESAAEGAYVSFPISPRQC